MVTWWTPTAAVSGTVTSAEMVPPPVALAVPRVTGGLSKVMVTGVPGGQFAPRTVAKPPGGTTPIVAPGGGWSMSMTTIEPGMRTNTNPLAMSTSTRITTGAGLMMTTPVGWNPGHCGPW